MTLDYEHKEIGFHNLFGSSIVLILQKLIFCSILGYHTSCYVTPAVRDSLQQFLGNHFFSEPQNISVIKKKRVL